jgi:hypothetical protein
MMSRLSRIAKWLWEGVWYYILIFSLVMVAWVFVKTLHDCDEQRIRFAGLTLQILGFFSVSIGIYQISEQFGRPNLIQHIIEYFQRFPWRRLHKVVIVGPARAGAAAPEIQARGRIIPPGKSVEDQIEALRKEIDGVHKRVDDAEERINRDVKSLREEIRQKAQETGAQVDSTRQDLESTVAGSLDLELIGVILFVLGVSLSTASPELAASIGGNTCAALQGSP